MKLLFLVTDDWFFLSHRLHLARAARDAGWDVAVVTHVGERGAEIEAEGFRLYDVHFGRRVLSQPRNMALLARLVRIYRRERPDIAHHVSFLPIVYGRVAALAAGVGGVVNTISGLGHAFMSGSSSGSLRRVAELGYKLALRGERTRALFQNPDDRELFVRRRLVDARRTAVVHGSGIDMERFAAAPEEAIGDRGPMVLLCGRMLWSKGVGVLVEAGRRLVERGIPHRLVLVGEPHPSNPESIPSSTLEDWHATGAAEWLGHRTDMPELLRRAHVVSLPSHYREGVPLALIEGAATGRPLVTTDMPGCREIVLEGENGFRVPPQDPASLADALARLLEDPSLRRSLGANGRELVRRRFSKEVVNAATLACYAELCPAFSPPGAGESGGGPLATAPEPDVPAALPKEPPAASAPTPSAGPAGSASRAGESRGR